LLAALALIVCFFIVHLNDLEKSKASDPPLDASSENPARELIENLRSAKFDWSQWLPAYQEAPEVTRIKILPDVIAAAKIRAARMRSLIKKDPAAALEQVLTLSDYAQLPQALLPYFEKPISGYGDIDLRWATSIQANGSLHCTHQNWLYLSGASYELYGPGRREDQSPALNVPVVAYVLDELALIPESPVLSIHAEEISAAKDLFGTGNPDGLDPVTKTAIDPDVAALIGGQVYQFSSVGVIEEVAATLESLELAAADTRQYTVKVPYAWLAGDTGGDAQGITERSFFADDNISVLFIRCDFADFVDEPVSQVDLETDLATISGHLNTMSYGSASVSVSVTTTLYRATSSGTSYAQSSDNDALHADVVAKYDAAPEYNSSSAYDVVAIYFPDLGDVANSKITYGGLASVGGSKHWINGVSTSSGRIGVIAHEFGHNYGLYHANYWHPEREISSNPNDYSDPNGNSLEYGDIFDLMGDGNLPASHFSQYQKNKIDWMPDAKVQQVSVAGTYKIYRFDDMDALDNPLLALRVPMESGVYYWVGFRQLYTGNTNAFSGAYVVAEGLYTDRPNLIDMTPGSEISESSDRFDACLPIGESFYDANSGVTITTVSKGTDGTGDEWLNVQIDFESRIGIVANTYEYDETAGVAYVTVERTFSSSGVTSIDYATSDDSAVEGTDYYAASGTLTWEDGEIGTKQIAIAIKPDTLVEGIEDFVLTLSNPSGGVLDVSQTSTFVSILDPGQRYASFAPDFFNLAVNAIGFQSDGRAIIGGTINHTSGDFAGVGNIARIDSNGDSDGSFNSAGSGFDGTVEQIIVQPDDSVIARGSFTTYNGTSVPGLVLLDANGALDTTFNANLGTAANSDIYTIARESDGKILVGGAFTDFNGTATEALIRLNSNGTVDNSLTLPFVTPWAYEVRGIFVEPDGKLVVVGSFYLGDGADGFRSGIARLNSTGTRDTSFDPDAGLHEDGATSSLRRGFTVKKLPDGDYLVGGTFTAYDQNAVVDFVRINSDGTFDRAYVSAFDNYPSTMLVEPFGAVLLSGLFNTPVTDFIRIKENWTEDADFQSSGGPDVPDTNGGSVYTLAYAPDGSLWLGGNLFSYNGSSSRPIVRLASGVSPYDFWAAENFTRAQIAAGDAAVNADPDGDQIVNLGEIALGTDPTLADASSVFGAGNLSGLSLVEAAGNQYLQMTLDKSALSGGVWYCVQVSSDLTTWSPSPAVPGDQSAYAILEDSATRLVIRDNTPVSAGSPRFARIVFKSPE